MIFTIDNLWKRTNIWDFKCKYIFMTEELIKIPINLLSKGMY